ncbi:MAG: CehA/McbA family metallohydrolase, partial [Deltaproteobacteria bacterium]|nr:CehA/McbA family metallohydrolase [Deltaproteobacteria bacterium]
GPAISYLYRPINSVAVNTLGDSTPIDHFTLGFSSVTVTNIGTQPLWFPAAQPGLLQAGQFLWMDLPLGERVEFEREVRVSRRADVASLSDRIYLDALLPGNAVELVGSIDDAEARVHVFRAGEGATSHMTMARPTATGRFSLVLPRGSYRLEILAPAGRRLIREVDLSDTPTRFDLGSIELAEVARVTLPRGTPMRLAFRGLGDTPDPAFGDDLSGLTLGGQPKPNSQRTSDVHRSGADHDPDSVRLAAGQYRVYATRGPEFSLTQTTLSVAAGEHTTLEIAAPERLFETPGWISADFHVHAAPSFDSTLPQTQRLRSFVAEGGEVLVATDHDAVSQYARLIESLDLGDRLTSLSGLELTSISPTPNNPYTTGHINLYPVPYRPDRNRAGAIQDEGKRLREIISLARDLPERTIVQLNHPRRPDKELHHGAFLDHLSVAGAPFDPDRPLDSAPNRSLIEPDPETGLRDIDFDAIELLNGQHTDRYRLIQRDWFSLLSQGRRLTGMANSDTHNLSSVVSMPRNYVRLARDEVEHFDRVAFISAAREGHVYGTTGPLLEVLLGEAGPGDLFTGNRAKLSVTVRAAPWVPVSILRIYRNGALDRELAIDGSVGQRELRRHPSGLHTTCLLQPNLHRRGPRRAVDASGVEPALNCD